MIRAVIDTNVVLASQRSTSQQSPNKEIVARWQAGAFTWLITRDIIGEYAEKLLEHGVLNADSQELLAQLLIAGEAVTITFFHLHHYPADADDTPFLLAALNGDASHLVTYDEHLHTVSIFYPEFITCEPREFLTQLRGAPPPAAE